MGAKEVAAGAEWLDEVSPGWEREIDLEILELANNCRCVLGQVFVHGSFSYTIDAYEKNIPWAISHGFTVQVPHPDHWAELDELWIGLIKERFDTGNLSDGDVW